MRERPRPEAEKGRVLTPGLDTPNGANYGIFIIKSGLSYLTVVVHDGNEDYPGLGGWGHVSVSVRGQSRCPTYEDLTLVKELFWGPDETVVHFWVPAKDHRNCHPHCLHLWRWLGGDFPRPPAILVAPEPNQ